MFRLTPGIVDPTAELRALQSPAAGALLIFEGRVRDHSRGRSVLRLEYQAQEALCHSETAAIRQECLTRFEILDLACVHRVGLVEIGEVAIWLGIASAHRHPAFEAQAQFLNDFKTRAPIWKKEHYADGNAQWIYGCEQVELATTDPPS